MPPTIYDYVDSDDRNDIEAWMKTLAARNRAKLDERLDKLHHHGEELFPDILSPSTENGILKLKCKGNVQLRPHLCRGPVNESAEYTLLMGAKEVGDKLVPANVASVSKTRKAEVKAKPETRRKQREIVRRTPR